MAVITGNAGKDDRLVGSDVEDEIRGLSGNDTLTGGAGRDFLYGGDGDDVLEAGGFGEPYDPEAFHKAVDDVLDGGAGNDRAILDYADIVWANGTDEPIKISFEFGANFVIQIEGFTGATLTNIESMLIWLANGDDTVRLGDGDDDVRAGYGNDTVIAGKGDDRVSDEGGVVDFDGGDGTDALSFQWGTSFTWDMWFDLETGEVKAYGDGAPDDNDYGDAINFETVDVIGSSGKDTILGGAGSDEFYDYGGDAYFDGRGGDDVAYLQYGNAGTHGTLIGGGGNDTLLGKFGTMYIDGGEGDDTLEGSFETDDTILGGSGNDTIRTSENASGFRDGRYDAGSGDDVVYAGSDNGFNAGNVVFEGGDGFDRLSIGIGNAKSFDALTDQGVHIAAFGTISGFEQFEIWGTGAYTGFDGGNSIATLDADDILRGDDGDDTLNGRGGDDRLDGGEGADQLIGGDGIDTATHEDSYVDMVINLESPEENTEDAAGDTYASIENVTGGSGNDTITGDGGDNVLSGGSVDFGDDGNDTLVGGLGSDTAAFEGKRNDYTITQNDDGSFTVVDSDVYGNGTDTLVDMEFARFSDLVVDLTNFGDNTPPSVPDLSKAAIKENGKANAVVGTVSASDEDGDSLTFTLLDDAGGAFVLDGDRLRATRRFDYEQVQSLSITLGASDGTSVTELDVVVKITDVMETIKGTKKNDRLEGGIGADQLLGLAGKDTLSGGDGADRFLFRTGDGKDKVLDYSGSGGDGDKIDLDGLSGVYNYKDLMQDHIRQKGANVVIDGGSGDVLTLKGVDLDDLTKADFLF
jgi:Ca2+-binding RTX toxin-like protein